MSNNHDEIERTEAPSPRWVAQLREHGHWPRSGELVFASTVLAGILTVRFAGSTLISKFVELLTSRLASVEIARPAGETLLAGRAETLGLLLVVLPFLLVPAVAAAISTIGQVGLRFHPESFRPSPARFDGIHRLGGIVSAQGMLNSLVAFAKWLVLFLLVLWWLWGNLSLVNHAASSRPEQIGREIGGILLRVGTKLALALVVVGAIDYARAWWTWHQQTQMSRAELVAEMRESEGDPNIRRLRRHRQVERGLAKCHKVLHPDCVVFLGKGKLAVAASAPESPPVKILARCIGAPAEHLRHAARKCGARVIQDDSVARAIYRAGQVGDILPTDVRAHIGRLSSHSLRRRSSPKFRV